MTDQPRARWPKYLLVPSEDQFKHGVYISFDYSKAKDSDEEDRMSYAEDCAEYGKLKAKDREALKYHCGTSCCLVGWACLAFGEIGCGTREIRNPATVKFLTKFMELAGREAPKREKLGVGNTYLQNFESFAYDVGSAASYAFEGARPETPGVFGRTFDYRLKISPRRALDLWKQTGDFFNYDTGHLLAG